MNKKVDFSDRCDILKWIFCRVKLPIGSKTVVNSWGCSQHLQQTLPVRKWCPRSVLTQVKCKNPGIKRWGSAWDANVTLPKPPKIVTTFYQCSNFSCRGPEHGQHGKPSIPAVRGAIYYLYVPSLLPLMLCIGGTTIMTNEHQAQQFVHSLCLRLANKH